ncbi:MAG: hypothetical protein PVF43_08430 [Candidatus Eiseniibacteriota bacterium]|jgi:hypothetical protein
MARTGERERFVRDFFKHFAVDAVGSDETPHWPSLPVGLRRRLRVGELRAVFRAATLEQHPDAQLMVPGNPVFDRILAVAQRFGEVSCRYRRAARGLLEDGASREAIGTLGDDLDLELGPPRYVSNFLLSFRVAYRGVESYDAIESVQVSGLDGQSQEGEGFFRGLNLAETPEPSVAEPAETVDLAPVLGRALTELDRRIAPRVAAFVTRTEAQLEQESERLKRFYTDLIDEEKARLVRQRGTARAVGAADRKLEWVQRLDRENRLFAPEVTVSLIGVEEIRQPARAVLVRRGREPVVEAELDLAGAELRGVTCASCEAELASIHLCGGEHIVCAECLEECALCNP